MGRSDVGQALAAMAEDDVREKLAAGDFGALPKSLDFTDDERTLVIAAAKVYPEDRNQPPWEAPMDEDGDAFMGAAYYSLGALASARLAFT